MPELNNPNYTPGNLLDAMLSKLGLKNDSALAKSLGVGRATMSKIRNRRFPVGPGLLVVLSESTGFTVGQLRQLMGLPPRMYTKG